MRKEIHEHEKKKSAGFKSLLRYVHELARHKLGYPVSLLTYLGVVSNKALGIQPNSLANILLNNVGDPFKDSETSLMEVKQHERELITILEQYYGMQPDEARGYVTTGGTEGNFAGLWWSKRYLINTVIDKLIEMDNSIKVLIKQESELKAKLVKIPLNDFVERASQLQKIIDVRDAIETKKDIVQQLLTPTVFFSKGHTHYSVPKISEILHLNIRPVAPNPDGSINLESLKKELILTRGAHPFSSVIVIANIGTTITGAIDDIPGIKKIIDELKPVASTIHMDGALTGFVMPILKPFGNVTNYFKDLGVNTLAVSAHKYPGLSQPCGILLAQRSFFEKAFEKSERSIDYVGNILDVTITGSRSGLNVLMFYNALHTFGMHKGTDKLRQMVDNNLETAKYLHDELVKIFGTSRVFYPYHFNVIFPRPSLALAKKYQLMLTGDKATICVLTNVTKELVDQFIMDLKADIKEIAMTTETKPHSVITLNEDYINPTVELFIKCFCNSEPLTKHLNIHHDDYAPFAREVVQKAAKEGLSKIAVDSHNKVVACCIAEDLADPFVPKISHYPKLKPVFALLNELSKPFMSGKKFMKGKIVHVWIAGVDPEVRGHGISTEVDMACIENAARKGYDFAYAEFTNELSERVTSQFSMLRRLNKINVSDFKMDQGTKPFEGVSGSAASYVATIRPGVKLEQLQNCYKVEEKY